MNNKTITERGAQGALLLFLYEVSIVVLIDFIAILPTPGILLIHIVNTNKDLIYFHSKNIIKMCFPKSWVDGVGLAGFKSRSNAFLLA